MRSSLVWMRFTRVINYLTYFTLFRRRHPKGCTTRDDADDVKNASNEVDDVLNDKNKLKAHSLVCSRATKKYRRLVAVNCVSLKISPSVCVLNLC